MAQVIKEKAKARQMDGQGVEKIVEPAPAAPAAPVKARHPFPGPTRREIEERYGILRLDNHGFTSPQWINQFLAEVHPPWQMVSPVSDEVNVQRIFVHAEVARPLREALDRIWQYVERDQEKINEMGLNVLGVSFMDPPQIREGKIDLHSYGAAVRFGGKKLEVEVEKIFKAAGFALTLDGGIEAVNRG